jgi:hypothetical protein
VLFIKLFIVGMLLGKTGQSTERCEILGSDGDV